MPIFNRLDLTLNVQKDGFKKDTTLFMLNLIVVADLHLKVLFIPTILLKKNPVKTDKVVKV